MEKFYRFWKKDFINKLIVLVVILITTAVVVDILLLVTPKSSGTSLLADLFPTPTVDLRIIMTQKAQTEVYQASMATASVPPTMTTMPFTPMPRTPTFTPTLVSSTRTSEPPATTLTALAGEANLTGTPDPGLGVACIPNTTPQVGKAVDILDGYTIKVLIDGLVYTVRYLGIELPDDTSYFERASAVNGNLVFGKEISLIADGPDKDQLGRLLRYVKVEGTFVNLELIQQGLAITKDTEPLFSCAEVFHNAEQSAREANAGIWKTAPIP